MTGRVLMLNSTYEPIKVVSWQRAVTMLCLGKVEVIRQYETLLRSVSWTVQMPAVIRLVTFVRRHRIRVAFSRRNIFLRDGYRCQYCQIRLPPSELTCDHVQPRSRGGRSSWENLVTACGPCNRRKGDRTPEQARMKLGQPPKRPESLPGIVFRLSPHNAPEQWHEFLAWHKTEGFKTEGFGLQTSGFGLSSKAG